MEKNREKAWEQNYVTDQSGLGTRLVTVRGTILWSVPTFIPYVSLSYDQYFFDLYNYTLFIDLPIRGPGLILSRGKDFSAALCLV